MSLFGSAHHLVSSSEGIDLDHSPHHHVPESVSHHHHSVHAMVVVRSPDMSNVTGSRRSVLLPRNKKGRCTHTEKDNRNTTHPQHDNTQPFVVLVPTAC